MSKDKGWYKRTHQFAPYTKADGQAVSDEFDAIQSSFDRIPEMREDGKGFAVSPIIPTPTEPMHPVTFEMLSEAETSVNNSRDDVTAKTQQVLENAQQVAASTLTVTENANIASQAASQALQSKESANSSEDMARKWAANPVDEVVQDDKYSAYHYATKAAKSAEILATAESSAKSNAEIATQKAEEAARSADKARNIAGGKVYYEDVLEVPQAGLYGEVGVTSLSNDLSSDSDAEAATIGVVKDVNDRLKAIYCSSVSALRSVKPSSFNQSVIVKSYHDGLRKGGGVFIVDPQDKTTPEDGGTVIIANDGNRWKRIYKSLSIFDFGAKAGFDVDNSDVIRRIESSLSNEVIDLCGESFYSTVKPIKNRFVNGFVQYSDQSTGATNYPISDTESKAHLYNASCGDGVKIAELAPVTTNNNAPSYYTQGFEQDPITGELWSMQSGDNNTNALVKYNFSLGQALTHQGYVYSNELSHQSFGIFYRDGVRYFICQPHGSKGSAKAQYLNVFTINETQSPWAIENLKSIKVLPQAVDGIRALGVSPSGEEVAYLYGVNVPLVNGNSRYMWKIAVFNIDSMLEGNIQPVEDFYIEKSFMSDGVTNKAIQDIAFDGSFVYVLHGGDKNNANTIAVYSRKGAKLVFDRNNKTGYKLCKQILANGGSDYYEAEGIFFLRNSNSLMLCMSVISGSEKGQAVKNTHLFSLQDVNQNIALGSQSLPAITINSDNVGIAFPNGKPLHFAEIGADGGYKTSLKITANQLTLEYDDTTQPQIILGNSLARGMFQASTSGNLGIYDLKKNNWLVATDSSGRMFSQKDWKSNFRIIYDDDTEPKFRLTNKKKDGMIQVSRAGNFGLFDITKNKWVVFSDVNGIVKLSSNPDYNSNGTDIATTQWVKKIAASDGALSNNGWTKLPNGLILQWGSFSSGGNGEFKFPISFNQNPYVVIVKLRESSINTFASSYTNTGFSLYDKLPRLVTFDMFAIGR